MSGMSMSEGVSGPLEGNLIDALSQFLRHYQPFKGEQARNRDQILMISNSNYIQMREKCNKQLQSQLDPRDRQVLIPFKTAINISHLKDQIVNQWNRLKSPCIRSSNEPIKPVWEQSERLKFIDSKQCALLLKNIYNFLGEVCQNINSVAFQLLSHDELKENQAKAFASKNIIANIQSVLSEVRLGLVGSQCICFSNQQVEQILANITGSVDRQLRSIFIELSSNYPQAPPSGGTARMSKAVFTMDKTQDQENDLIYCNVKDIYKFTTFEKVRPQGYIPYVLEVLNTAIKITSQNFCKQQEITIFEKFQEFSQRLFHTSQLNTYKKLQHQSKNDISMSNKLKNDTVDYFKKLLYPKANNNSSFVPQFMQNIENQCSLEDLRKKHHYQIGQKIPKSVNPFRQDEIDNRTFAINNSALLRVMTKWSETLEEFFQSPQDQINQRIYPFKTDQDHQQAPHDQVKTILCANLKRESQNVKQELKKLRKQNTLYQSFILSQGDSSVTSNLKRFTDVRLSASQMNAVLIQFTLKYLCILIYHLIEAGKFEINNRQYRINLVVLRLGDLLRSKYQCSESTFINLLNIIYELDASKEMEGKFKIVRIKNKLSQKDNNILINYMFLGKIQCELQLSIQDLEKKDKNYYAFCHFLYELTRGNFGVLTEFTTIISQHDPIVSSYPDGHFRPQCYETHKGNGKSHSIHEKNNSLFLCWKCKNIVTRQESNLFLLEKEGPCNQCIIEHEKPEVKLEKQQLRQLIINNLNQGSIQRLRRYKDAPAGSYVLSISNRACEKSYKLFRIYVGKEKFQLVQIDQFCLDYFRPRQISNGFVFQPMQLFRFNSQLVDKPHKSLKELTYFIKKEQLLQKLLPMKYMYLKLFIEKVECKRKEEQIINYINSKAEIMDLDCDIKKIEAVNRVAKALSQNGISELTYDKSILLNFKRLSILKLKKANIESYSQIIRCLNELSHIQLSKCGTNGISFENQLQLKILNIFQSDLTEIVHLEKNKSLTELVLYHNEIENIDLSQNINLKNLDLRKNLIKEIDLSCNIHLKSLYIEDNKLASIKLNNPQLTSLHLKNNKLTSLSLRNSPEIVWLYISDNCLSNTEFWFNYSFNHQYSFYLAISRQESSNCKITLIGREGDLEGLEGLKNKILEMQNGNHGEPNKKQCIYEVDYQLFS